MSVIPLAASQRFSPCEDAERISAVRKKYGIPGKCRYLLSLCTLEPRKNLPFTIKAFARFARQHEDVVLVLAGSHWAGYAEEMEKALQAVSGMRSRVIMPGYIADEDQAALYSGAMAFVYMSIYEGFGLPPLEAMQCGTPIITSNVSSLPEVAGMAGIQVSPDDLDGLVRAMSHVAENGALRKELRTKGLERCKRFSWKNAVDIIVADIARECKEVNVSRPKRLLFDATILRYGLNDNSGRSGVYVASYELLKAMQDRPDMLVDLWIPASFVPELQRYLSLHPELDKVELSGISCGSDNYEATASRLESYVAPQLGDRADAVARLIWFAYLAVRWPLIRIARFMHKRELRDFAAMIRGRYDGFFSPVFTAPEEIVRCGLPRYTVLYDTIPMLYPQFYAHATEEMWTSVLARKLTAEDKCFAISECTKRDFLKFSPNLKAENVSVIPLAAAERFYPCTDKAKIENVLKKYKLPTDRRYFLSLCTIEPRKNLAMALKAFAQFAKTDKDMIFILAGGGWDAYSAKWKDVLRSVSAIRKRIYMPGYIADEDLSPLYSGARAFVYMSIYEGFGLPPLEAMQCGVPVLSSNSSSLPEVVGDAALTVAPDDLDGAVDAMTRLASDDELCASLRQKGIARVKLFSWERAAEIISNQVIK